MYSPEGGLNHDDTNLMMDDIASGTRQSEQMTALVQYLERRHVAKGRGY